jgi:hypothetical protein
MRDLLPFAVILSIGIAQEAHASVISQDLTALGDGLVTYDTVNKREWLDLPETSGVPLSEVLAQMEPGARLEGYRFATLEDVTELTESAGVNWLDDWAIPGPNSPLPHELVKLLGPVYSPDIWHGHLKLSFGQVSLSQGQPLFNSSNAYVFSLYGDAKPGDINVPIFAQESGGVFESSDLLADRFPDAPTIALGNIGPFWLYRSVPEPCGLVLLSTSIAWLFLARLRCAAPRG